MTRVISLFREADDGYPVPEIEPDEYGDGAGQSIHIGQPLYFVELLNYLHGQKQGGDLEKVRAGAD